MPCLNYNRMKIFLEWKGEITEDPLLLQERIQLEYSKIIPKREIESISISKEKRSLIMEVEGGIYSFFLPSMSIFFEKEKQRMENLLWVEKEEIPFLSIKILYLDFKERRFMLLSDSGVTPLDLPKWKSPRETWSELEILLLEQELEKRFRI